MSRRRILRTVARDDGAALVSVLGVMVVIGLVSIVLMSVTVFNTTFTAETRSGIRAQAAADAGIDITVQQLDGRTYQELHQICGTTTSVDGIAVTVTTTYTLRSGVSTACPTPSQGPDVVRLTVTSQATTGPNAGGEPVARSVVADIAVVGPPFLLDKAIFGENAVQIRNNTSVHESEPLAVDGNVYSNGGGTCPAGGEVEGDLRVASGSIVLERCRVAGDLWSEGAVSMSTSDGLVEGDVISASTGNPAVRIQNSSNRVHGSVVTNGSVHVSSGTVGIVPSGPATHGSVMSVAGEVRLQDGARVGGSTYAHSGMFTQENTRVGRDVVVRAGNLASSNPTVHVGGTVRVAGTYAPGRFAVGEPGGSCMGAGCSATFPAAPAGWDPTAGISSDVFDASGQVKAPPRENLPKITSDATALATWEAEGWSVVTFSGGTSCSAALDHVAHHWTGGKLLVDVQGCSGPVRLNSADARASHRELVLRGDLAILSDTGFETSNMFKVTSADGAERKLYWIVPADAPGVSWLPVVGHGAVRPSCAVPRDITVDRAEVSGVSWFLYTPCSVVTGNNFGKAPYPVTGQIYGGTVSFGGDGTVLRMPAADSEGHRLAVPSLAVATAPAPTAQVRTNLVSRYDVTTP